MFWYHIISNKPTEHPRYRPVARAGVVLLVAIAVLFGNFPFLSIDDDGQYTFTKTVPVAHAAATGANDCSSAANDSTVGSATWSSLSNGCATNGSYSSVSVSGTGVSQYLSVSNFGFTTSDIPSGSIIDGIEVAVDWYGTVNNPNSLDQNSIKIVKGGTVSGTDKSTGAALPTSEATTNFGGTSDLWGVTWSDSDVRSSDFGVALSVVGSSGGGGRTVTGYIDTVTVTITYTPPFIQLAAATSSDPAALTLAPGGGATTTNAFTLVTTGGTATATALTLSHAGASSTDRIEVISDDETTVYGSTTMAVGTSTTFTLDTDIVVTTSTTTYKIRVTPKSHTDLPSGVLGKSIPLFVAVETASATKEVSGTDTAPTHTIDNQSLSSFGISGLTTFATTTADYLTGTDPYDITAVDLNNDGHLDLAAPFTAGSPDGISIFISNGDGTFASKVDYTAGNDPFWITAADFNLDGYADLAVANATDDAASVLLNNGDGTFATAVAYGTGPGSRGITAGDFNLDGYADLAVTYLSGTPDGVSVLLNDGDGTFATKEDYDTGGNPYGVTAADVDDDGDLDLLNVNFNDSDLSVFLNNGDGTFATKVDYPLGAEPYGITTADFDKDGDYDVVVANVLDNDVSVLLNNGNGTFATKVDYPVGTDPYHVSLADFNNDGHIDISVSNYDTANASVLTNDGDGTFAAKRDFSTSGGPYGLAADDFDFDGLVDLAVVHRIDNDLTVLQNQSTSTLTATTTGAAGGEVIINYTTPPQDDLDSIIILASTSAVTDAPTDGTTYTGGESIGSAEVVCVDSGVATSTSDSCTATGLTGGTAYYFSAFVKDTSGNYSVGVQATGSPATPTAEQTTITLNGTLYENDGSIPYSGTATITAAVGTSTPSLHSATTDGSGNFSITGIATSSLGTFATSSGLSGWRPSTLAYGNGRFVGGGKFSGGRLFYSDDGRSWTAGTGFAGSPNVDKIAYGDGTFVAIAGDYSSGGPETVLTSHDGITWTQRSAAGDNDDWRGVAYGDGTFVAAADCSGGSDCFIYSNDQGVTWSTSTSPFAASGDNNWRDITYGDGRFVATERDLLIAYSDDGGQTWASSTISGSGNIHDITYGDSTFVAASDNSTNEIFTSPDGISWTARQAPLILPTDHSKTLTYANGTFVGVDDCSSTDVNSCIMYSTDQGATWATTTVAATSTFFAVTYGQGQFVALNSAFDDGEALVHSTDAGFGENAPITLFVDGAVSITASTLTYGVNNNSGTTTIVADLIDDTLLLTKPAVGSSSNEIYLSDADFYNYEDDIDVLFTATTSTTTIHGDLQISSSTNVYSPQHLVIDGDFDNQGTFSAEKGAVVANSESYDVTYLHDYTWASTSVAGVTSGEDVQFDATGSQLYVVDRFDDEIRTYNVSTPYDLSTISYNSSWTFPEPSIGYGMAFNATGSKLFISGTDIGIGVVAEYTLSTPYDVSSASHVDNTNIDAYANPVGGVAFSDDGLVMVVGDVDSSGASVDTFTLSAPFDASTASYDSSIAQPNSVQDVRFVQEGRKLIVTRSAVPNYVIYTLSSAYDISTVISSTTADGISGAQTGFHQGFDFNADGTTMYVIDSSDNLYEISLDDEQTFSGDFTGSNAFADLTIANTLPLTFATSASTTDTFTIASTSAVATGATTTTFNAGSTYTFENIDWQGSSESNTSNLRSSVPGTQWSLDVPGNQHNVQYLDVQDSDATLTSGGITTIDSTDSGNNLNWSFADSLTISGTLYENDGSTPYSGTATITVAIAGDTTSLYSTTADGSGAYTITDIPRTGLGTFATSSGISNWRPSTLAYGNGRFVGGGKFSGDRLFYSDHGRSWTAGTGVTGGVNVDKIVYGDGTFVAVVSDYTSGGSERVLTSPDGITWTPRSAAGDDDAWPGVAYGDGTFVAVADCSSGGDCFMYSNDQGVTWSTSTSPFVASGDNDWRDITYGDGRFVAIEQQRHVAYSDDGGQTWASTTISGSGNITEITYGDGTFVVASTDTANEIFTSPDGVSWTAQQASLLLTGSNAKKLTYGNGTFVGVNDCSSTDVNSCIMYSTDQGATWATTTVAATSTLRAVAYGQGQFVALDDANDLAHSADAGFGENTPITLFVDNVATTSSTTASTLTYGVNNNAGTSTISGIDLAIDTVRLQHSSTSGTINLADADVYDSSDDPLVLFTATTSTTTIDADLTIASGTTVLAPQHLVLDGDFTQTGSFRAESGEVHLDASAFDLPDGTTRGIRYTGEGLGIIDPKGIHLSPDGSRLYIAKNNETVRQYNFGTAYDATTLSFDTFTNIASFINGELFGITFNTDGSSMYVMSSAGTLLQFDLSTAWDVTTRGFVASSSLTQSVTPHELVISPDGSTVLVQDKGEDDIDSYTLTTPGDVSAVTYDGSFSSGDNASLFVDPAGRYLVIPQYNTGQFKRYTFSTPWDISTLGSADRTTPNFMQEGNDDVVATLDADGRYVYAVSFLRDILEQYELDTPQTATGTLTGADAFATLQNDSDLGFTFGADASTTNTFTIDNAAATTGATTTTFNAGSTYTFENIDWQGSSASNTINLRSSVPGTQWNLDVPGNQHNVQYLDVQDSDATLTSGGITTIDSTDSGNNLNWSFADSLTISGTLYENDGSTPYSGTATITAAVAGDTTSLYSTTADGSGAYTITDIPRTSLGTFATSSRDGEAKWPMSLIYGNGRFVGSGTFFDRLFYSDDGVTWTLGSFSDAPNISNGVAYGDGVFVAVVANYQAGGPERVLTSPDGITWTQRSAAGDDDAWYGVAYGDGTFVATTDCSSGGDCFMYSNDQGVTWSTSTSPFVASGDNEWSDIAYGDGRFVAVESGRSVAYSDDGGQTWASTTFSGSGDVAEVIYGDDTFVVAGDNTANEIFTSPDGESWTARQAPLVVTKGYGQSLTYGNGTFLGIADCSTTDVDSCIMYSTDQGATWATTTVPATSTLQAAAYGQGKFIVLNNLGSDGFSYTYTTDAGFGENTPITLFVDGVANTASTTASTLTYGVNNNAGTSTISGIDLAIDTVRLQHSSTSGTINLADADVYDSSDDPLVLFTATTSTTTIDADLTIAPNTTVLAPQHLVLDGDFTQTGSFRAESGEVHLDASAFDMPDGTTRGIRYVGDGPTLTSDTRSLYVTPDGTKLFVSCGNLCAEEVKRYDFGTAYDVTTLSFDTATSLESVVTAIKGLTFQPNGSRLYVVDDSDDSLHQFDLSTPWDITTASFVASSSISQSVEPQSSLSISPDGTTIIVMDRSGADNADEYTLSTAWDISTLSYDDSYSFSNHDTNSLFVDPAGRYLIRIDPNADNTRYTFGTPWDVSTLSGPDRTTPDFVDRGDNVRATFDTSGRYIYAVDISGADVIDQYELDTPQTATGTLTGADSFFQLTHTGDLAATYGTSASTTHFTLEANAEADITEPFSIDGNYTNNGMLTRRTSELTLTGNASTTNTYGGSSLTTLGSLRFTGGTYEASATSATTTNLTIESGATLAPPQNLTLTGSYINNGTVNFTGSNTTLTVDGSFATLSGTLTGASALNDVVVRGNAARFLSAASTSDLTIAGELLPYGDGVVSSTVRFAENENGFPNSTGSLGTGVATIGDLNGDGVPDLAVGDTVNDGAVYIVFMNADGSASSTVKISDNENGGPSLDFFDFFGSSITNLGDLNGDGVPDLAVGADSDEATSGGDSSEGAVHILFMNTDGTASSTVKISDSENGGPTLDGGDNFGSSITNLGDLNGDGVPDLAVGAEVDEATSGGDGGEGAVHILFMNTDGTASSSVKISDGENGGPSLEGLDRFGGAVTTLGDLNGDGVPDLAVGAYTDEATSGGDGGEGAVHILFMNTDGTASSSVKISDSENGGPSLEAGDNFGSALTTLGDLNGDGVTDLAVGASNDEATSGGDSAEGAVHILFLNADGTAASTVKISDSENGGPSLDGPGGFGSDNFGSAVTNLGDLNGDGVPDLAVGAQNDDSLGGGLGTEGVVHILFLNAALPALASDSALSVTGSTTVAGTLTSSDTNATEFAGNVSVTGTLALGSGTTTVTGAFTHSAGTVAARTTPLLVTGNVTSLGDFDNSRGRLTLTGTGQQTVTLATTSIALNERFEAASFPPAGWQTGGDTAWSRTTATTSGGSLGAAVSGDVADNETSWLQATTTLAATSTLGFDWRVSSQSGSDFLVVCVNQATCSSASNDGEIAGDTGWLSQELVLAPGQNVVRFAYVKDGSVSDLNDEGYVDNVHLADGPILLNDLTVSNQTGNGTTTQAVTFMNPISTLGTLKMSASTSAAFAANATSTFTNVDWQGSDGSPVWLRSTTPGAQWYLDIPGEQLSVDFVDVADSNATSTGVGVIASNSADSGNNTNWFFSEDLLPSDEWNATDWTQYDTITIKHENIDESLTDFPVYVDLADLSADFWSTTPSASSTVGTDIRVTTDDGTPVELPRELVSASSTAQTGELHFKADFINKDADTSFRIYYNGTTTGDYLADAQFGAQKVWQDYGAAWHMDDGVADQLDSSAQSNTAVRVSGGTVATGRMGDALEFAEDGRYDLTANITNNSNRAFSFWYYKRGQGGASFGSIFGSNDFEHGIRHLGTDELNVLSSDNVQADSGLLTDGDWYYVTFEWDGTSWSATTNGSTANGGGTAWFGSNPQHLIGIADSNTRAPDGVMDEMRVGPARSIAWRKAEYINQSTTTDFYSLGAGTSGTGSTTVSDHDATQVNNAFDFQNQTNEPLFAFKLTPESGTSTVTELTLELRGAKDINVADFSNITLYRDHDNDAAYDATDTAVGTGVMSLGNRGRSINSNQIGTIVFSEDFTSTTTQNYLVVADWNYPERGSSLTIDLRPEDIEAVDADGAHVFSGNVDHIQHNRSNSGGGGGSSAAVGAPAPAGDGVVSGGGSSGGGAIDTNTDGDTIGNETDFKWPTAGSGDWGSIANAYDQVDGTYATTGAASSSDLSAFNDSVPGSDTIEGIAVKLEGAHVTAGQIAVELSFDGGSTYTTAGKVTSGLSGTDQVVTLGGPSDTWGRTWSPAEFSDANFRVRITGNALGGGEVRLDAIQVRVYHQATGGSAGGGGAI